MIRCFSSSGIVKQFWSLQYLVSTPPLLFRLSPPTDEITERPGAQIHTDHIDPRTVLSHTHDDCAYWNEAAVKKIIRS